jgi:hypothetical protein
MEDVIAGHIARNGEKRNACRFGWEIQKERDHWEQPKIGEYY